MQLNRNNAQMERYMDENNNINNNYNNQINNYQENQQNGNRNMSPINNEQNLNPAYNNNYGVNPFNPYSRQNF